MRMEINDIRSVVLKRIYGVLIILSFIFLLITGCGKGDSNSNININSGAYVAEGVYSNSIISYSPTLWIDMQEGFFRFTYDPLSSYLNAGTMEIKDNTIIAKTGRYSFVFHIESETELKFVQKGSSIIKTVVGNLPMKDGTLFVYKNE